MQPYQEASEEFTKQSYRPFEAAAAIGGAGLKTAISGKIMSMLNKYVPTDLAIKGLNKIDPRLGKFLSMGQKMGYSENELRGFIENKIKENPSQEPAKQKRNIIEQYSPELNLAIKEEIKKGKSPFEATNIVVFHNKQFEPIIKKIMKDHKTPWSAILQSVYGSEIQPQQNQQQTGLASIGGIASGMMDNFYNQAFEALKKGSNSMSGVKDPLLEAAKPAFNAGQIKSAEDLKNFSQFYKNQTGQHQVSDKWNQIASSLQNLLNS